jgi:hypothetical protein
MKATFSIFYGIGLGYSVFYLDQAFTVKVNVITLLCLNIYLVDEIYKQVFNRNDIIKMHKYRK